MTVQLSTRTGSLTPAQPRRILVRSVNWLGDAIMATPALTQLRHAYPQAQITVLTPSKLAPLWRYCPAVNDVILFDSGLAISTVAQLIRSREFDLALILPNSFRSALECFLARVPVRIGYAGQWRNRLLTHPVPQRPHAVEMRKRSPREIRRLISTPRPRATLPPEAHHIFQYLHLAAAAGASSDPIPPELHVPKDHIHRALLQLNLSNPGLLLGLNPGAEYGPAKRWPEESFAEAAIQISRQRECHWIIFGGKNDQPLANNIASRIRAALPQNPNPVTNAAGQTSLEDLCALLSACSALLTNDTGPMHIAAAVGTSVVVPFGSTSPELTGPGLLNSGPHQIIRADVPCAPCFLRECPIDFRCMQQISPSTAADRLLSLLPQFEPGTR